jgi:hypothetical protein
LQAGFAQPALIDAAKRHPIQIAHDNIIHGPLPFPLLCVRKINVDLARLRFAQSGATPSQIGSPAHRSRTHRAKIAGSRIGRNN